VYENGDKKKKGLKRLEMFGTDRKVELTVQHTPTNGPKLA